MEEAKDLVDVDEKKPEVPKVLIEEQKLAEEKRQDYVEERVIIPAVKVPDADTKDETRNQTGPSAPMATPRSSPQKIGLNTVDTEGDSKRVKLTPSKPVHGSEGEHPEPKRLRMEDEIPQVERRVQSTGVGSDTYYHMDQFFGKEEFLAWDEEEEESPSAVTIPQALR